MVLEIFATWCEICASEVPTLNRVHRSHPEVDVLAVTGSNRGVADVRESAFDVKRYQNTRHVQFELAFDDSLHIARDYRIFGFPSIYVIDRHGKIVFNQVGAVNYSALEEALQASKD